MRDPYQILGVSRDASADQVRRAYRFQAMRLHPDRAGGDAGQMAELNAAHDQIQADLARGNRIPISRAATARAQRPRPAPPVANRARLVELATAIRDLDRILRTFPRKVERALERLEGDPYDLEESERFGLVTTDLETALKSVMTRLATCDAPGELHGHVGRVEQGLRQIEDALESWERYARYLDLDALVEGREILVAAMDWLDEVMPVTLDVLEQALGLEGE